MIILRDFESDMTSKNFHILFESGNVGLSQEEEKRVHPAKFIEEPLRSTSFILTFPSGSLNEI
jgi:hypothetical protein